MKTNRRIFLSCFTLALVMFFAGTLFAEHYEYNAQGRLTSVTYDDGSSVTYTYDAAGNITETNIDETGPFILNLEPDWNLVSIPVWLPDNILSVVLQTIDGKYEAVWTYDAATNSWKRYVVGGLSFLNDLDTIEPKKGYWFRMSAAAVLSLDNLGPVKEAIALVTDWNLVGFNSLTDMARDDALSSIVAQCTEVWTHNATDDSWEGYAVAVEPFLNNLSIFRPGKGYWIQTTGPASWDVSGSAAPAPASPKPVAARLKRKYTLSTRPEIPYTVWGTLDVNGEPVSDGSTVVLNVDNKERSRRKVKKIRGYERYGGIYRLDVQPTVGRSGKAELYVKANGMAVRAASIPPGVSGQTINLNLSVQIFPKISLLHQSKPDPVNPGAWIPYELSDDADVIIKICTSTGQLVRTLNLGRKPAGFYTHKEKSAHWDGKNEAGERMAEGVYHYSIQAGEFVATKKMIVAQ